jgi:hypothetical protein
VYYQLYAKDGEIPSKVAIVPEEPSLGRIRADSVAPPHTVSSIRRRISKVEGKPLFTSAKLFADRWCETPMKETHVPIIYGKCPGLSRDQPMALVSDSLSPGYTIKIMADHTYSKLNFNIAEPAAHGRRGRFQEAIFICEERRDTFH